jgi:hypothetical protein
MTTTIYNIARELQNTSMKTRVPGCQICHCQVGPVLFFFPTNFKLLLGCNNPPELRIISGKKKSGKTIHEIDKLLLCSSKHVTGTRANSPFLVHAKYQVLVLIRDTVRVSRKPPLVCGGGDWRRGEGGEGVDANFAHRETKG